MSFSTAREVLERARSARPGCPRVLAQLREGARLKLANLRGRHRELLADFADAGAGLNADAKPTAQNHFFARRQRRQRLTRLVAQISGAGVTELPTGQTERNTPSIFSHAN